MVAAICIVSVWMIRKSLSLQGWIRKIQITWVEFISGNIENPNSNITDDKTIIC